MLDNYSSAMFKKVELTRRKHTPMTEDQSRTLHPMRFAEPEATLGSCARHTSTRLMSDQCLCGLDPFELEDH